MDLLRSARDSLNAAQLLLNGGYPAYAASRAYYAMFYIAEAFLEGEGMAFSKHAAVISAFGREFANKGKVPVELHRFLLDAMTLRHAADYGPRDKVKPPHAQTVIEQAKRFIQVAERLIGPIPPEDHDQG